MQLLLGRGIPRHSPQTRYTVEMHIPKALLDNTDGTYHQYCAHCFAETVERQYTDHKTFYICSSCGKRHERSIVIDPAIKWWVGEDGEYWHESAGVFVRNSEGKFLFFERLIYPFAVTTPAGHVDTGEDALTSARRELEEEVGLAATDLTLIGTEDIVGDSCRRGSDAHRWHAYLNQCDGTPSITVTEKDEGHRPTWLTLDEALTQDLTFPVKYIINKYRNVLESRNSI